MPPPRALHLARLAAGLPAFLVRRRTAAEAAATIRERMATREERFLAGLRRLVRLAPEGPLGRLLAWAGVEPGDLETSIGRDGLESTLERLRDAGVYVTLPELRGVQPIRRGALTIAPRPGAFRNPALAGAAVSGTTSGTRSAGMGVTYTWGFLAEEAAEECLLHDAHGSTDVPLAMWMLPPPAIAGIHNLLLHLRAGRPPERWFAHAPLAGWTAAPMERAALAWLRGVARTRGMAVPPPEHLPLDRAADVARWMLERRSCLLKTYVSSAVRLAGAASAAGIDLRGRTVLVGGEALTARRRRFIESVGLTVHPRYVTTESGLVAAGCGRGPVEGADAMHVYLDRLAVVAGVGRVTLDGRTLPSLAFTSLSPAAPYVLLNTELGDHGLLARAPCECRFGRLGMDLHLAHVASPEKLTAEGMNLLVSDLEPVIGALIERLGGAPDDYQLWESHDARGIWSLTLAVSPEVRHLDERLLVDQVLQVLRTKSAGAHFAPTLWSGALRVVRERPRHTAGQKLLPVIPHPRSD